MERKLLLDANLAVLLVMGLTDKSIIPRHKNRKGYDGVDFDILSEKIGEYSGIIFTPHILCETSNLVRQIGEPLKSTLTVVMGELIRKSTEIFVESKIGSSDNAFSRLGLIDAISLKLSGTGAELLTDDFDLYAEAAKRNLRVENFTHIREARRKL
jgi:hypothetical protein